MTKNQKPKSVNHQSSIAVLLFFLCSATSLATPPIDFTNDVIPLLTKHGCNAGACHGSAAGRGGLKLSLYGGNPPADLDAIVYHLEGRRVNQASPEDSLIVLKPTESISHGGGYVFEDESDSFQLLVNWIRQGAEHRSTRSLAEIEVSPPKLTNLRVGDRVKLQVTANYDDATQRDVSRWTVLTSEDNASVSIDAESNELTIHRAGRHIVVARYLNQVIPIELISPIGNKFAAAEPAKNWIDKFVSSRLTELGIPVSPPADEAQWVRRVTLDLTGRLPSAIEVQFSSAGGRAAYVDALLDSDAFVEYWTLHLAKLLRVGAKQSDAQATTAYHAWLAEQIRERVGYDTIARELITAAGDTHHVGPANFYRTVAGAREQAELFSEVFMGSRLRCANCHNHPLDHWTQDDYHGLAAMFAGVQMARVVSIKPGAEVIHPATLEPAVPRIPNGASNDVPSESEDQREALAVWLTRPDNPYFAQAIVNRLWSHLLGRGLVHPVDDFRATNPATHPELLARLADDFVQHAYDLRHTLRLIATSATYARSSTTLPGNQDDDRFYSHALPRMLSAEVLADAVTDVLGVSENYGNLEIGTRAVSLPSPQVPSLTLDILGRCERDVTCETETQVSGGLKQKLHLLNGKLLNARIGDSQGRLSALLDQQCEPLRIVNKFYEVALNRKLTDSELAYWQQKISGTSDATNKALLEDLVWSVLTCEEFATNH